MKKNLLTTILFLTANLVVAQNNGWNLKFEALDPSNAGKIFHNTLLVKDKPKGSPYLEATFATAKVANVSQPAFMRYNVCSDEFEFITVKHDTLILDKIDDFKTIVFTNTNKKYQLVSGALISDSKNGYLILCYEKADVVLYKKENIILYEGKIAKTSLERDMPAKYEKAQDTYFLKIKNNAIVPFPKNKNQLVKLFPNQKEAVANFIKDNEIDFKKELDLIKVCSFTATF